MRHFYSCLVFSHHLACLTFKMHHWRQGTWRVRSIWTTGFHIHTKTQQTSSNNIKNPEEGKKNKRKEKETWLPLLPPFSATLLSSHNNEIPRCVPACVLGRCCSSKNDILVSSSEMGPCFQFPRERNLMRFSLQLCGFPAKFMKFGLAVRSPVEKTREKSKYNNWVCRSVSVASLGVLLLNTKIIFCIEVYLL